MIRLSVASIKQNLKENTTFYLAAFFLVCNALFYALALAEQETFLTEAIKFLQFFGFIFLLAKALDRTTGKVVLSLLLFAYYTLIGYQVVVGAPLDVLLVKRRWSESAFLLVHYSWLIAMIAVLAALNALIFSKTKRFKASRQLVVLIFIAVGASTMTANNEFFAFAKQVASKNQGVAFYEDRIYRPLLQDSIVSNQQDFGATQQASSSLAGKTNHIVMVQIESLNARLVSASTTPNFLEIARHGVFFPRFYGNSVQTILAQENILCSLPSSMESDLSRSGQSKAVACLPKLLKKAGYKNYFFESGDLNFENSGSLMRDIGFDQVRGAEMGRENDPKYLWGLREDAFLDRAFENLSRMDSSAKSLVYLHMGPTNHWPFDWGVENKGLPEQGAFKDRFAASMSRQDRYLAGLLERFDKIYPQKDYILLIYGDHSWPAAIQSDNFFNQRGALDENFLTSMAFIVGGEDFGGKQVAENYSHMDTLPTLMQLLGQPLHQNRFSRSYAGEITGASPGAQLDKNILLIQPYSDRYVSLVRKNGKYLLNLGKGELKLIDLDSDFHETGTVLESGLDGSINSFSNLIK
jgi:phosphoglycerol transferase MdoB-like AlkP superfamily enzyme